MSSRTLRFLTLLLFCAVPALAVPTPETLRVDYVHFGNAEQESFALQRVVVEPLPWPGNPDRSIDDTNLGKYRFELIDRATHQVVYSRGFASIYGEWETTGEARRRNGSFVESVRFPRPATVPHRLPPER
jgi:hypothetical protein